MQDNRCAFYFGKLIAGTVSVLALISSTQAQPFPSRPIEVVAHTSAGSGTDLFARTISDILTKEKIKEFSERNIFEDRWMGSAAFTDYLNKRLADQQSFLKAMGALK